MPTAQAILDDVRNTLGDEETDKRWADSDLLLYLNEAVLAIARLLPQASAVTAARQLTPGTKQVLPAGGLRLLDVTRNMGSDGLTPGKPVFVADWESMRGFMLDWHTQAASTEIRSYVYDDRNPKVYYVEPPVHAVTAVFVEEVYSQAPTAITAGQNFQLDDIYVDPAKTYMKMRAYESDISSASSQAKVARLENSFYTALGLKKSADIENSPNTRT